MTVYILRSLHPYPGGEIVGVFSSPRLAKDYAARYWSSPLEWKGFVEHSGFIYIEKLEIDPKPRGGS